MYDRLTPEEAAPLLALGILPSEIMPQLADRWLMEGYEAPTLVHLMGLKRPILSEVGPMLEQCLKELGIALPTKVDALHLALPLFLRPIVTREIDAFEGMRRLDRELHQSAVELLPQGHYLGDSLGVERLYTWYRELQDARDGSMLLYYRDLPIEEAVGKFREHLIEEAADRLRELEV